MIEWIAEYQKQAEDFWTEEIRELYQVEAGLKEQLDLTPLYLRYNTLFAADRVKDLLAQASSSAQARYLAEFAALRYLRNSVKELDEEITQASLATTVSWDGQDIPFRTLPARIAREADQSRRHQLEDKRLGVIAALNPLYERRWVLLDEHARNLDFSNYTDLCDQLRGLDLAWLIQQAEGLLEETQDDYTRLLRSEFANLELPVEQAHACDLAYLFRASRWDEYFPKENLLPSLTTTLGRMGISLEGQTALELDLEPRPLKSPRPFCASIRVPGEIKLVIKPRGGQQDYRALYHEAGHAQHSIHTDPQLPFAYRCLGDESVSEAYAFLFENLTRNPRWQARLLGKKMDEAYCEFSMLERLHQLRRIAAKVLYETELHRGTREPACLYANRMQDALCVHVTAEPYLSSVDDGLYCAQYLRALMLQSQLALALEKSFGAEWFAEPGAGQFLISLWKRGQAGNAEDLSDWLGFDRLDLRALGFPGDQVRPSATSQCKRCLTDSST